MGRSARVAYVPAVALYALIKDVAYAEYFSGCIPVVFLLLADGLGKGQSPGKKICKIQVVSFKTGLPCGLLRSVIRNLFLIDFLIIFGAIIDVIFLHANDRRIGDYAASTCVVNMPEA
jgi:uncharacterized RDD family membrane protein YckC